MSNRKASSGNWTKEWIMQDKTNDKCTHINQFSEHINKFSVNPEYVIQPRTQVLWVFKTQQSIESDPFQKAKNCRRT